LSPDYGQPVPSGYGHQAPPVYGQPVPSGYGHQAPPVYGQPMPPQRRVKPWMIGVAAAAVLAVGGAAVTAVVFTVGSGPTLEDAQRECRTAFENEFSARKARIESSSVTSSILTSVIGIELQESRKTDAGFEVNGVVRYDMTATLVPTVHDSLSLTCEARDRNSKLVTTVKNRA
jgi:hypothetical protein